jgi:hypothetical protein
MVEGDRMILKGRLEVRLGGMTGVTRLSEKRQIRQFQVRDDPGNGIDHGEIGASLQPGMGEHQGHEQHADTRQNQGRARFSQKNASLAFSFSEASNQGF